MPTASSPSRRTLATLALALVAVASPVLAQSGGRDSLPTPSRRQWGHYLDLPKARRIDVLVEGTLALDYQSPVSEYTWEVPGEVMAIASTQPDGSMRKVATLRWDATRGGLLQTAVDGSEALWVPQPDGSLQQGNDRVRITERAFNNGTVEQRTEVKRDATWELAWVYHRLPYQAETAALLRQLHANAVANARIRSQIPAKYFDAAQARERQAARERDNGGYVGSSSPR